MNGFDYAGGSFTIGDWNVTIGPGGGTIYNGNPYPYPYPGTTYPGGVPIYANNQNSQLMMIGLIVLALYIVTKR